MFGLPSGLIVLMCRLILAYLGPKGLGPKRLATETPRGRNGLVPNRGYR